MPKVFIGLDQGLTKAREEVVGTMNTVRCNHWLRYMSWAWGSYERWKLTILYTKETCPAQSQTEHRLLVLRTSASKCCSPGSVTWSRWFDRRADWFGWWANQGCSAGGRWACSSHYPPSGLASVPGAYEWCGFPTLRSYFCVVMSSSKSLSRKHLASEISKHGTKMAPCTKCRNAKVKDGDERPKCIVGP